MLLYLFELAKNQAKAEQNPEAELLLFDKSSTLLSKTNMRYIIFSKERLPRISAAFLTEMLNERFIQISAPLFCQKRSSFEK